MNNTASDNIMNEPGVMKMNWSNMKGLRYGAVVVAILFGVTACTWHGMESDDSGSKRLYIRGHSEHISDQQVAKIVSAYLKANAGKGNIKGLEKKLAKQSQLVNVWVVRHGPDGIEVHLDDRDVVANWGAKRVLLAGGRIIDVNSQPDNLVDLKGNEADAEKIYAQYRRLSGILSPHGVHLAALTLEPGMGFDARLDNGLILHLGHHHIEERAQRFVRYALTRPQAQRVIDTAGYVDLRYSDGFAVGGSRKESHSVRHEESLG